MNETILVTGSSGYVGSHTAKYLSEKGCRVLGLDEIAPSARVRGYLSDELTADISDEKKVGAFLKRQAPVGVIHCAAKCLVAESVEKPDLYFDYNVTRSSRFVDLLEKAGVMRIVFSSTAATYGEPIRSPIREDHPQNPINPYGKSKLRFEKDLLERASQKRIAVGIVRYFNAAGAAPDADIGEVHDPETHLIPNAIFAALGKKKEFLLYGDDYATRDGTCERDFVHVWDLAQAHLKFLNMVNAPGDKRIYNLGSAKGYTVKEVLDEVDRQTAKKLPRKISPRRPGDPAKLVADAELASRELGWNPEYSTLEKTVATALAWHRKTIA